MEQIIRIPYKYGELFYTMDDKECGKLIKALFKKDKSELVGLSLTYYNIIIVDIDNIEKQVEIGRKNGKKGGRPRNKNPRVKNKITPPLGKSKPNISKDKIKEDKINISNIKEKNIKKEKSIIINNKKDILKKYNINENELNEEIEEFINYWTAPVRRGKNKGKQLWETKETFVPNIRFATWLRNNKNRKKNNLSYKPQGIGIVE